MGTFDQKRTVRSPEMRAQLVKCPLHKRGTDFRSPAPTDTVDAEPCTYNPSAERDTGIPAACWIASLSSRCGKRLPQIVKRREGT